jgi:hypothetical protein
MLRTQASVRNAFYNGKVSKKHLKGFRHRYISFIQEKMPPKLIPCAVREWFLKQLGLPLGQDNVWYWAITVAMS